MARLLIGATVLPDRDHTGEKMRAQRKGEAAIVAAVAERFKGDRARQRVEAAAAVFLGHGQPLDADLGALAPQVPGERLFAIAIPRPFVQFASSEFDDVVSQEPLLIAQREIHAAISLSRR
jgi:hypothetical protein